MKTVKKYLKSGIIPADIDNILLWEKGTQNMKVQHSFKEEGHDIFMFGENLKPKHLFTVKDGKKEVEQLGYDKITEKERQEIDKYLMDRYDIN